MRSSGLSILYALGTTIFGGTTQFVVAWLIDRTGSPMVPAWYMLAATIAAIAGVALLKPHPEAVREQTRTPRRARRRTGRPGYCVNRYSMPSSAALGEPYIVPVRCLVKRWCARS